LVRLVPAEYGAVLGDRSRESAPFAQEMMFVIGLAAADLLVNLTSIRGYSPKLGY